VVSIVGLVLFAAVSCKPKQQLTITTETLSVKKDKLTPVAVQGDSTKLKALFRCDSLNNVLMVSLSEMKSKNMNSNLSFVNGELNYNAQTKPDTVFIKSTDTWYYVTRRITKTYTVTKNITVNIPDHGFIWWVGLITILAITAFAVFKLVTWSPVKSILKKLLKIN
jgi:hypothetical protein